MNKEMIQFIHQMSGAYEQKEQSLQYLKSMSSTVEQAEKQVQLLKGKMASAQQATAECEARAEQSSKEFQKLAEKIKLHDEKFKFVRSMLIRSLQNILDLKFVSLNQKGEESFIKIMELRDNFFSTLHEEIDPFPEAGPDMPEEV